jgi:TetR/AcrR family transcriptional regulator, cholesterol catabolism regulator
LARVDETEFGLMPAQAKARAEPSARYEQRRLEVLRAAAKTFNRKGFHIATLDDVAEELGVTKPALYYYASSKDELLAACGQLAIDALNGALDRSVAPDASPADRLRGFFTLYAEIVCGDFGRCLALTEPRDLAPATRKANHAGRRGLNLAVREIIREGVSEGVFRPCDDRVLAIALFDAFNGLAKWFDPRGGQSLAWIVEQYLGIFLDGVANSAGGGSPGQPPDSKDRPCL